jgi:hypothetical protein
MDRPWPFADNGTRAVGPASGRFRASLIPEGPSPAGRREWDASAAEIRPLSGGSDRRVGAPFN